MHLHIHVHQTKEDKAMWVQNLSSTINKFTMTLSSKIYINLSFEEKYERSD